MQKLYIQTKMRYVTNAEGSRNEAHGIFKNIDNATRAAISRVSNIIRLFADNFVPLTDALLLEAYEWVIEQEGDAKYLLLGDAGDALITAMSVRG